MNEAESPKLAPVEALVHFVLTHEVPDEEAMMRVLALRRGPLRQLLTSAIECPALQEGIKDPNVLHEFQHLSRTLTERDAYGTPDYEPYANSLDELFKKYEIKGLGRAN